MAEINPQNAPLPGLAPTGPTGLPTAPTGADTLSSAPSAPDEQDGNLPMPPAPTGGASMLQQLQAKGSPFLKNLATGANKAAAGNPQAASQPGGWARTLLSGAMSAISGGNGLADSLSDAAAATEPVPPGGGALTGVLRTLKAGQERKTAQAEQMSREKSAELLRAETTQRIAANTRNIYRQDQADRTAAYASNDSYMKNFRARYETQNDQDGITQDQLNGMLQKDPNFWKVHTGRATGQIPVMDGGKQKIDQNGQPVFEPTYSISNIAETGAIERTRPVTEDEATYFKNNTSANITAGTQLTANQFDNLNARADGAHAMKQKIAKANGEDLSADQERQLNVALSDPRIQHYMSMNPQDPTGMSGLYAAQKNTAAHISSIDQMIQSVQQKVPTQPGQPPNPAIQALQQKRQEFVKDGQNIDKVISGFNQKAGDEYIKRQDEQAKEAEVIRHNKADEAIRAAETNINNSKSVPLTPEVQNQINSLPGPQKNLISQYDPNTQSALMAVAFGNGEQDLEKNFPSRLTKGAPGLNTQQALGVLHQLNGNWSEQSYAVKQGMYKSATTGKLSQQSDSLNNFIGHAAEAQAINNKLFNAGDPKIFKSTVNELSKLGYGTDAVSLQEAISVVNGEFDNMVKSGYAPTQDEAAAQATLVNANSTVGQINAAMKVMSHMAATRASTMNQHYKTATGDNFPNLINEDNQDSARMLGIPVDKFYTGGRIGGSGSAPQMQNTQTGTPGTPAPPAQGQQGGGTWGSQFGAVPRGQ